MDLICPTCGARVELVLQHATSIAAPHPLVAPVQASDPELISVAEAAKRLGISAGTAYAEMQAGQLPSVRIGRRRLVPVQRLQQYIEEAMEGGPNRSVTERPQPRPTFPVAPTYRRQTPVPPPSRRAPRDAPPAPSAPPPEPVPSTRWMTTEEHEASLARLSKDGWPDDVLQHMREEEVGPYTVGLPEVARQLGLAKATVYNMAKVGELPVFTYQMYVNERPKTLIGVRRLAQWIKEQTAEPRMPRPGRPRGRKTRPKDAELA